MTDEEKLRDIRRSIAKADRDLEASRRIARQLEADGDAARAVYEYATEVGRKVTRGYGLLRGLFGTQAGTQAGTAPVAETPATPETTAPQAVTLTAPRIKARTGNTP